MAEEREDALAKALHTVNRAKFGGPCRVIPGDKFSKLFFYCLHPEEGEDE